MVLWSGVYDDVDMWWIVWWTNCIIWIVIQHTLVTTVQQNCIHKTKIHFFGFLIYLMPPINAPNMEHISLITTSFFLPSMLFPVVDISCCMPNYCCRHILLYAWRTVVDIPCCMPNLRSVSSNVAVLLLAECKYIFWDKVFKCWRYIKILFFQFLDFILFLIIYLLRERTRITIGIPQRMKVRKMWLIWETDTSVSILLLLESAVRWQQLPVANLIEFQQLPTDGNMVWVVFINQ